MRYSIDTTAKLQQQDVLTGAIRKSTVLLLAHTCKDEILKQMLHKGELSAIYMKQYQGKVLKKRHKLAILSQQEGSGSDTLN